MYNWSIFMQLKIVICFKLKENLLCTQLCIFENVHGLIFSIRSKILFILKCLPKHERFPIYEFIRFWKLRALFHISTIRIRLLFMFQILIIMKMKKIFLFLCQIRGFQTMKHQVVSWLIYYMKGHSRNFSIPSVNSLK